MKQGRESVPVSVASHTAVEAFAVVAHPEITSGVSTRDCRVE